MTTSQSSPSFVTLPSDDAEMGSGGAEMPPPTTKFGEDRLEDGTIGSSTGDESQSEGDDPMSVKEQKIAVLTKGNSEKSSFLSRIKTMAIKNPVVFLMIATVLIGLIVYLALKCFDNGCDGDDNNSLNNNPSYVVTSESTIAFNATDVDAMNTTITNNNVTTTQNKPGCSSHKIW